MEAGGIEPASEFDVKTQAISGCNETQVGGAANALHACGHTCLSEAILDADLQYVVHSWAKLPEAIKSAILTLVQAAQGAKESPHG